MRGRVSDESGMCSIHSVEALLSALECCGVNNARIEIEGGGEVPTLDGSAMVRAHNSIACIMRTAV